MYVSGIGMCYAVSKLLATFDTGIEVIHSATAIPVAIEIGSHLTVEHCLMEPVERGPVQRLARFGILELRDAHRFMSVADKPFVDL